MHKDTLQSTTLAYTPIGEYPSFIDLLHIIAVQPYKHISNNYASLRIVFNKNQNRVRKINKRSNTRMTGKYPSRKNGRMMHWESPIELMGFKILEASAIVKTYSEQPAFIHYHLSGRADTYHVPDVLVEFTNGRMCFVEFKHSSELTDIDLIERSQFMAAHLPALGYNYIVIVKEQMQKLVTPPVIPSPLKSYKHYDPIAASVCQNMFKRLPSISLSNLVMHLSKFGMGLSELYGLIIHDMIIYNSNYPLMPDTILTWGAPL